MEKNGFFDTLSESIIHSLTYVINTFSGLLQIVIYLAIFVTFCFALRKAFQALRTLAICDQQKIARVSKAGDLHSNEKTPLGVISALFFLKTKKYYYEESKKEGSAGKVIPPDAFIRDAAYQFSERHFQEKFLEPISMLANLLPPLGFIGTIMGMVVHFLSNSGSLNSDVTVAGIATALYTTFIALICFTTLEFLKKIFYGLALKRIDQGLGLVAQVAVKAPSQDAVRK